MNRIGIRIENEPGLSAAQFRALATEAEARGFEMIWVPESNGGRDSPSQIASLVSCTDRARLATGILPIFGRTPLVVAMTATGLAFISGGRFVLGLGTGDRMSVEDWHGIAFERPLARMREMLEIVRALLDGKTITRAGAFFNLRDAKLVEPPAQRIPLYVAALGPKILEMAGELADGVLLNWTPAGYLAKVAQHIRVGAERAGRDPRSVDVAGYVRVAITDDPAPVRADLARQLARYGLKPFYRSFFRECGFAAEMDAAENAAERGDFAAVMAAMTPAMQDAVTIIGSPERCRAELDARRALGLALPVVAPVSTADGKVETYRRLIDVFGR